MGIWRRLVGLSTIGVLVVPALARAEITTGTYVGNGVAGRSITGLGFRPDVVLIKIDYNDSGNVDLSAAVMRTWTMSAGMAKPIRGSQAPAANYVQSLDANGFTVGDDERVNWAPGSCGGANCTYYWTAFKADANLKLGFYVGNGGTQAIAGLGFSPEFVLLMPMNGSRALMRSSQTSDTHAFSIGIGGLAAQITSLDAGGFTVTHDPINPWSNAAGVTYHYAAWNEVPGKMKVGSYVGNGTDDRSIPGVGFRPTYLISKIVNDTLQPYQRFGVMTGDISITFGNDSNPNRIQSFLPDGFQVGSNVQVNSVAGGCPGPADCNYFYVAFADCCTGLTTSETPTSFTVTAQDKFELVFSTESAGTVRTFHDLANDPGRTLDLVGGDPLVTGMYLNSINNGGYFDSDENDPGTLSGQLPKMDLLEATPTRVKVRQESFYQAPGSTNFLPGAKATVDHSVYPSGRLGLRMNRRTTQTVPYTEDELVLTVHYTSGLPPLDGWAGYSESGAAFPEPGTDRFTLAQIEATNARTDFLNIIHRDWNGPSPAYHAQADETQWYTFAAQQWGVTLWGDFAADTLPAGRSEVWDLLTYFKPTNFVDHTDPQVIERADDYRGADPLSVSVGTGWNENTRDVDFFNESEAAYTLDVDTVSGLTFDMNGSVTTRFSPFFKIRQWRSLAKPATVTLAGTALVEGTDYRTDVKPFSRAHYANVLSWHSTFENASAVTSPDVGSGGTVVGAVAFPPGRYGAAANFDAAGKYVSVPAPLNFNAAIGTVEFWYQPNYDCIAICDNVQHVLWQMDGDATHFFLLEKSAANNLDFTVRNGASVTRVRTSNFNWLASDWVHIRVTWDDSQASGSQLHLFVNEVEPVETDSGTYNAIGMVTGPSRVGGDAAGTSTAAGLIDEFHMYTGGPTPTRFAYGGLTSNGDEFLADFSAPRNRILLNLAVDGAGRGQHVYFGSDSRFRGLNVSLATAGTNVADDDIDWEYWNGTAWGNLELVGGFADSTKSFKATGSVFWTSDPGGWDVYSVNGGPDLYYVRAHLKTTSIGYGIPPVESVIKTDILLLQYCGDITAAAQTFSISPPIPTAVRLQSFAATAGDSVVDLAWTTASELRNLGFHLYRSLSPDGPGERITSSLMPGLGSSPQGASYFYRDSGLSNGTTYFYWLEDVETTGRIERHGPVEATPTADTVSQPPARPANGLVYGDPSATVLREVERTARGVVLELVTSGFTATVEPGGSLRVSIPGFIVDSLPGAPEVPVKRSWLDVPPGVEVRVAAVSASQVEEFELTRPRASGSPELVATRRGTVVAGERRAREGSAFRASGWYPSERGRVVESGYQGETQKALVELAPLSWDRTSGRWRLARRLTVRLVFTEARHGRHRESRSHGAADRRWQLVTREKGLHGVRFQDLLGRGQRGIPTATMELSRLGEKVAYHVEPEPGRFAPGSVLYFVSEGPDVNPYGNEAVYELSLERPGLLMPQASSAPTGPPVGFYWERLEREEDRYYQAGLLEAEDLWLWDVLLAPVTKTFSFSVRDLKGDSLPSRLVVRVQGTTDFPESPDHHLRASVNGTLVGESRFEGKTSQVLTAELLPGVVREGDNELELENVGDTGASYSMVMLDRFEVSYPRSLVASSRTLEGRMSESGVADIEGLESGAIALDVSGDSARWLEGAESSANGLRLRVESGRSYLVVSPDAVRKPEVRQVGESALRSGRNRADYIVVGPRDLLGAAQPLLDLRRSQGLVVKPVDIEEVYRAFGFGESRPEAVREFLAYAYHHWRKPAPRYVLLLGDATYDFKDHLATGVRNQVPPLLVRTSYLWTASDPSLAMVNGEDGLPDLAIGRLPAKSPAELERMVRKILAYEARPVGERGAAVLVADNSDRAGDFEADAEEIAASFLPGRTVEKIYLGQRGTEATRGAVVEAFDSGASLVSYVGHGGIHLWAEENVLETAGVSSLAPQPRQPIVLTLNCLNGYFHFPYFDSLAEALLKAEAKGAVAALSPSGLSLNDPAHLFHKAILTELHSGRHRRLGDALAAAQETYAASGAFPELLRIYHLLGDPALTIR